MFDLFDGDSHQINFMYIIILVHCLYLITSHSIKIQSYSKLVSADYGTVLGNKLSNITI